MIRFEGVVKSFGQKRVLDALSLDIKPGKITFILGKSGEGKSVTIKHMMGLLKPDAGKIYIHNDEISRWPEKDLRLLRRHFGLLFQHAALFDSMTVVENVAFPLHEQTNMPNVEITARVQEVLAQCGLEGVNSAYPASLSMGEKKRVGLARALAAKPEFLLYDEPTTGMDPLISEMIDQLIVKVAKEEKNLTSIVISHDLKAALDTADEIIMLYKGKVALCGTPLEFRQSTDPVVRQFFSGRVEGPMEFL